MVVGLATPPEHAESTGRLALLQTLRATFTASQDVIASVAADRFVVLHRVPGSRIPDHVPKLGQRVVEEIARRDRLTAAVGIGDIAGTVAELHDSYQDASMALRLGTHLDGGARRSAPSVDFASISCSSPSATVLGHGWSIR